jgi:hypothetical protein
MRRFVLLYHDCPPHYERPSHWDFMLEVGAVLRTWALSQLPRDWRNARARTAERFATCPALAEDNRVAAVQLGDHRIDYLEIEGPLSRGRGAVTRVAEGRYRGESETADGWQLELVGDDLSGKLQLARPSSDSVQWFLNWQR